MFFTFLERKKNAANLRRLPGGVALFSPGKIPHEERQTQHRAKNPPGGVSCEVVGGEGGKAEQASRQERADTPPLIFNLSTKLAGVK